jgi:hypothetical protein
MTYLQKSKSQSHDSLQTPVAQLVTHLLQANEFNNVFNLHEILDVFFIGLLLLLLVNAVFDTATEDMMSHFYFAYLLFIVASV